MAPSFPSENATVQEGLIGPLEVPHYRLQLAELALQQGGIVLELVSADGQVGLRHAGRLRRRALVRSLRRNVADLADCIVQIPLASHLP